ncbi:hypothetical protein ANCDUO_18990, partial [Ancylostoma duodenale]
SLLPEESTPAVSLESNAITNNRDELVTIQGASQEIPSSESSSDVSHALATEIPPSLIGTDGHSQESSQEDDTALPGGGTAQASLGPSDFQTHKVVSGQTLPASDPLLTDVTDVLGDTGGTAMDGAATSDLEGRDNSDSTDSTFTLGGEQSASNAPDDQSYSIVTSETMYSDWTKPLSLSSSTYYTTTLGGNGDPGAGGSGVRRRTFPGLNGDPSDSSSEHSHKVPSATDPNTEIPGQSNTDESGYSKSGSLVSVELSAAPSASRGNGFVTDPLGDNATKDYSIDSTNNADEYLSQPTMGNHETISNMAVTVDKSTDSDNLDGTPSATDHNLDISP